MRLDPVLLAAPNAPPALMPTRRAFVLGGAMFTTGLSLGGACGYAIGSRRAEEPGEQKEEEQASSGDADLDELRRLAVKAPIEELVKHRATFLMYISRTYRRDSILWRGVDRLVDEVLNNDRFPERAMAAQTLAQVIDLSDPGVAESLRKRITQLRKIR